MTRPVQLPNRLSALSSRPWVGDVILLLVSLAWGSSYITAKTVLHETEPYLFLFLRFLVTVLIMLPFVLIIGATFWGRSLSSVN